MNPSQLIAFLNSLNVGELDSLASKLGEARRACVDLGEEELADNLGEAQQALTHADLKLYRKRVHHVLARLGHLR